MNKELEALISLLDEPDENTYDEIKKRIFSYGPDAIPSLETAWENSFDNLIQVRIENIIRKIQLDDLYHELSEWGRNNEKDLLKGFYLASRYHYPDQDEEKISNAIGRLIQDIWLELNDELTALEKVKVMNHIIFEIHKYSANKSNFYAPENFFLKNLIETKKGNPISLGIFYIIIAKSLKIPIYGVNLPKHFILAYADELSARYIGETGTEDILFYINPFNKGAVFTKNEIELYIKQLKLKSKQSYYKPCSNNIIIRRLFEEIAFSYKKSGYPDKVSDINKLLKALH